MNETATYNQQYYEQHRNTINERRKSKYQEDEDYRQKAIERAKEYYARNRDKIRKRNRKRSMVVFPDGHTERALQISDLGERIGKKPFTIRTWLRKGLIPDSPLRRSRIRYYTPKMITVVANALPDTFRKDWEAVSEKIERGWERLGVYDSDVEVKSL